MKTTRMMTMTTDHDAGQSLVTLCEAWGKPDEAAGIAHANRAGGWRLMRTSIMCECASVGKRGAWLLS